MNFAFSELFLLLALLSGLVLPNPLGAPPLPEDPRLLGCAPTETLAYVQWFGTADPNPRTTNATEQLAAEPDVRNFFRAATDAVAASLVAEARGAAGAREAVELGQLAIVRPGCAFVVADPSTPGAIGWGLVVQVGERAERALELSKAIVASFQDSDDTRTIAGVDFHLVDGGGVEAGWTLHRDHLAFGFGRASLDAIAHGLDSARGLADNPRFAAIQGRVAVARPSLRTFVDAQALLGLFRAIEPEAGLALDAFGISGITGYGSESGLEADGYVIRSMLSTSEREGLLGLSDGPGLDAASLALVPADATAASVVRIDVARAWQVVFDAVRAFEPDDADRAERQAGEMVQQMFGLDLQRDLLAHLGDTWAVWSSPSQGSLLMLGACACVTLKDPDAFAKSFDQMMDRIHAMYPESRPQDEWGRVERGAYIERLEFDGTTIHWLNTIGDDVPLAPAWCVRDGRLWFATFPQVLQSALSAPEGARSLADAEDARAAIGARMFSRVDMGSVIETLYSPLLMLGQLACAEMQRDGLEFDISALPRFSSLRPHLGVETMSVQVEAGGLVSTSHGTIPRVDPGLGFALPIAGIMPYWLMSTRVEMARAVEVQRAAEDAKKEAEAARRKRDGEKRP